MLLKTILFLSLFLVTMAAPLTLDEQWERFKEEYGKTYESGEEAKRFAIFKENVKVIEEHNKRYEAGEVSYQLGINAFTDLTHEEFQDMYTGIIPNAINAPIST